MRKGLLSGIYFAFSHENSFRGKAVQMRLMRMRFYLVAVFDRWDNFLLHFLCNGEVFFSFNPTASGHGKWISLKEGGGGGRVWSLFFMVWLCDVDMESKYHCQTLHGRNFSPKIRPHLSHLLGSGGCGYISQQRQCCEFLDGKGGWIWTASRRGGWWRIRPRYHRIDNNQNWVYTFYFL